MLIPTASSGQNIAAAASSFNPETDITWHSLWWAEGTAMAALGLSNGASVTTWPNETTETDATGTSITYVASSGVLNSQPSVANTTGYLTTTNFSVAPSFASGLSVVMIHGPDTHGNNTSAHALCDGNGSSVRVYALQQATTGYWGVYRGATSLFGTNATNDAGLTVIYCVSATGNTSLIRNGTTVAGPGSSGVSGLAGVTLLNNKDKATATAWTGEMALYGIYEGNITADGEYANFKSWILSYYGITVA